MNQTTSVIRLNQAGYACGLPVHFAVLSDAPVTLRNGKGEILPGIRVSDFMDDEASGDRVSAVTAGPLEAGQYELQCGDEKRRFTVSLSPWEEITAALVKGLYFQRCGCELKKEYAGRYAHPACHTGLSELWEDRGTFRRVHGGWHDAGDYGKYTGPGAVTVAHLIYAWKLFPDGCGGLLNIPESGNGIPDILNEARYELEWILQMQRSDGAFHHKQTKARFAGFIMPQDDREQEYLMPVSHCATAAACGCLALASRVWKTMDPRFSEGMLSAAECGWQWLENHPEFEAFQNPVGVRTGTYSDQSDTDERFWAACELYAATGNSRYRLQAEEIALSGLYLIQFGWSNVAGLGALCCLFDLKEKAGTILYDSLKEEFLKQSLKLLSVSRGSGYGTVLRPDEYVWGSNLSVLCGAMALILHSLLTGREDMRDAAILQWHYILGMNAMDVCYVTGFGENRVMFPHHRPSGADGIDDPVPGLLSGGPNNRYNYPAHRERLGDTPPAKSFLDETPSADTNEIAIYWNSPAVFVGAYFNSLAKQQERSSKT